MANTFTCPSCGAPLVIESQESTIHCEYCGATVIVPPELLAQAATASTPEAVVHPSQAEGEHGKLSPTQMRQVMAYIRGGQIDQAKQAFQAGTGASSEVADQTVQMIANQVSTTNMILPADLASIMRAYAEIATRTHAPSQQETRPQRRGSGLGCWLVLIIILAVFYFSYTSLSPVDLANSLLAGGKAGDPVMQTAIAPFHALATTIAPLLQ